MLGRAAWTTRQTPRGPVDEAWVPFEVVAGESYLGSMELLVDDAPFRESGQHNHTSTLHWGHLSPVMRAVDYTKKYVVIESLSDGRYRLAIVDRDPHA